MPARRRLVRGILRARALRIALRVLVGSKHRRTPVRGGFVYGASINTNTTDVGAGTENYGIEVDLTNSANGIGARYGVIVVSPASSTGTVTGTAMVAGSGSTYVKNAAFAIFNLAYPFDNAIQTIKTMGGVSPIRVEGSLWRAGGFSVASGLELTILPGNGNVGVGFVTPSYKL